MNDRERILHALTIAGEHGLTDFELADVLSQIGLHIYPTSAGARRNELVKDGLVAQRLTLHPLFMTFDGTEHQADGKFNPLQPDYRPGPTARKCAVWVLAEYSKPVKL